MTTTTKHNKLATANITHKITDKSRALLDNSNWLSIYADKYLRFSRFKHKSRNKHRFQFSLFLLGNRDSLNGNLINRDCHKKHTEKLNVRFQRKINKIIKFEQDRLKKVNTTGSNKFATDEFSITDRRVRIITVLYSVVGLNSQEAIRDIKQLKNILTEAIKKIKGVACLGAFEVEVVSVRNMRLLRKLSLTKVKPINNSLIDYSDPGDIKSIQTENDQKILFAVKEYRKLDNCERLGSHLGEEILGGESGALLVHFHGLVTFTKESQIEELRLILNEYPELTIVSRQIKFQTIRRTEKGVSKSLSLSIRHLARYFTKGGNDFLDGKSYLQYKIKLPDDTPLTYDEQLSEWDQCEHQEDIESEDSFMKYNSCSINNYKNSKINILTLSVQEINVLAKVIHEMMNWNTTGTGYLLTVGRW